MYIRVYFVNMVRTHVVDLSTVTRKIPLTKATKKDKLRDLCEWRRRQGPVSGSRSRTTSVKACPCAVPTASAGKFKLSNRKWSAPKCHPKWNQRSNLPPLSIPSPLEPLLPRTPSPIKNLLPRTPSSLKPHLPQTPSPLKPLLPRTPSLLDIFSLEPLALRTSSPLNLLPLKPLFLEFLPYLAFPRLPFERKEERESR